MHRALLVRSQSTQEPCRCCKHALENIVHLSVCDVAGKIFEDLRVMAKIDRLAGVEMQRFALFGLLPASKLDSGWINLILLLWKYLVAAIVRVELEGEKYDNASVWAPAWIRFEQKANALAERVNIERRRADSRGEEPKCPKKRARPMSPLASFSEEGKLVWDDALVSKIKQLGKKTGSKSR